MNEFSPISKCSQFIVTFSPIRELSGMIAFLALIEKFGADALRMTLAAHAAQGRDIKLSESRVEGYRNFATKLWNAARFCELNGCQYDPKFAPSACTQSINQWIIGKLINTARQVESGIEDYKFNEAAGSIYQFIWGTFCDWYVDRR